MCNKTSLFLGRAQILHDVDFVAAAGEVTCIVGPNGCGKTTLLKALTCELAYEGHIALNGVDIRRQSPQVLATQRAVLPQATNLAFPFTVLEVVRIGLTAGLSTNTPEDNERLPLDALARVGLAGFEGRFYQELSGGEKQRVQLARVLVQTWEPVLNGIPRWLFLDEPVSALDIAHQLQVMAIARDFARAGGGVVAVMHDLNLTAMFSDRITLMANGREVRSGTPKDVLRNEPLRHAYNCDVQVNTPPADASPWLIPQAARAAQATGNPS
ncbi:MAG: heme ABC transporter ATP-binding protein [Pseudomonadota bacterium]